MSRRILLLITDLQRGGTPTVVRELAVRLSRAGVAVEVACLSAWGPVADELAAAGVAVTALGATGPADLRVVKRLIRLVREREFGTVFSFLVHANAVAAAASLVVRPVRWIQSIQTTQPWPAWHWRVQRIAAAAAEAVVVPSAAVAAVARERSGVPGEKIIVIPNAIEMQAFENPSPIALQEVPPVPYPVTFLGRLDPVKDVPTLIEAVAKLEEPVRLNVFGEGADRPRIEQAMVRCGVTDRVRLRGMVARPMEALRESGLLVLPSQAEGFGLVLIEAMAARVPVVASNIPAVAEIVEDGETGLLVPAGDAAAFAQAIAAVVDSADLRRDLVNRGQQVVREHFSWEGVLPRYLDLLR